MNWTANEFDELSGRQVYEILKLRVNVFVVEQSCAYHEIDDHDYGAIHICCLDGQELVAYARLLPAGVKYKEPSIGRVIIKEDHRGTGLAHTLMERSMHYILSSWKPDEIRLQAQTHLSGFYGKHGFDKVSEPYDEDGIPHVDMIFTSF
ncbi:GNAT family N-acetyltransferase [Filibacter tadaridae]|uniref:Putative acyltransferase n=1 Tax=Filibacter tadaridae TaxID=2483811 RepID=A0A3P5WYH5_9BACL|nr:GNAT family N-acetyltransferase [Filibacter tadaridae]VDC19994.1 putative acyltransferase [Filibacter tadaridae]